MTTPTSGTPVQCLAANHTCQRGCKRSGHCDHAPIHVVQYVDKLERELQQARANLESHQTALLKVRTALGLGRDSEDDLLQVIESMRAEIERLRGYVQHQPNCQKDYLDNKCTCGLEGVLK